MTLLERWTPATFVGEPTGDPPNGYGDPKRTVLPNSGLTVQVSTLYWQVSNPKDRTADPSGTDDCLGPR